MLSRLSLGCAVCFFTPALSDHGVYGALRCVGGVRGWVLLERLVVGMTLKPYRVRGSLKFDVEFH